MARFPIAAVVLGLWGCKSNRTGDSDLVADHHAAVVGVADRNQSGVACAGTVIAPTYVLTAAHCVEAMPHLGPALDIFFGATREAATERIAVAEIVVHPSFSAAELHNDLAILRLATPTQATPLRLWSGTTALEGRDVRFVGFSGHGDSHQRKRAGISRISGVGPTKLLLGPAPALPCANDSGGPVLLSANGTDFVIGVISSVDRDCREFARATKTPVDKDSFLVPYLTTRAP